MKKLLFLLIIIFTKLSVLAMEGHNTARELVGWNNEPTTAWTFRTIPGRNGGIRYGINRNTGQQIILLSDSHRYSENYQREIKKNPKSLKELCFQVVKTNKKLYSQNQIDQLPFQMKKELGLEKISQEINCAICFDELGEDRKKLKCGHDQFCRDCIAKLKATQNKAICPICRKNI